MTGRDALTDVYLRTTYRVLSEPRPIDIHIGHRNTALDALLSKEGVREWAFVTASNPRSRRLSERENARRNQQMMQELQATGRPYLAGIGVPAETGWQPEQSVLILGIGKADAVELARCFEQHAIVFGRLGDPAQLVWTE